MSSLSTTDHSLVLDIISFTNSDQWIRAVYSVARRRLSPDLHASDGRGRVVDREVDQRQVDSLMWLDTDESRWTCDVSGDALAPDTTRYDSSGYTAVV